MTTLEGSLRERWHQLGLPILTLISLLFLLYKFFTRDKWCRVIFSNDRSLSIIQTIYGAMSLEIYFHRLDVYNFTYKFLKLLKHSLKILFNIRSRIPQIKLEFHILSQREKYSPSRFQMLSSTTCNWFFSKYSSWKNSSNNDLQRILEVDQHCIYKQESHRELISLRYPRSLSE